MKRAGMNSDGLSWNFFNDELKRDIAVLEA